MFSINMLDVSLKYMHKPPVYLVIEPSRLLYDWQMSACMRARLVGLLKPSFLEALPFRLRSGPRSNLTHEMQN